MTDGYSRWIERLTEDIYPSYFDTSNPEPTDEYQLQWDTSLNGGLGGAKWVSKLEDIGLTDLSDVLITSIDDKHILLYDGITDNRWENILLEASTIGSTTPSTIGTTNSEGSAETVSRTDHIHQREHAIFTPSTAVSDHSDITDAGSGIVISDAERTALHAEVDPFPSGTFYLGTGAWVTGNAVAMTTDGTNQYANTTALVTFVCSHMLMPKKMTINGTTKYLKITSATLDWYQVDATDDLDSFGIWQVVSGGADNTVKSDGTNRGIAGHQSFTWTSFSNNTLSATADTFTFRVVAVARSSAADFRIRGCEVTYEYV